MTGERLLKDNKIAEVAVVCWPALEEHERASFRLVAKEQDAKSYAAGLADGEKEWAVREQILTEQIQGHAREYYGEQCQARVERMLDYIEAEFIDLRDPIIRREWQALKVV